MDITKNIVDGLVRDIYNKTLGIIQEETGVTIERLCELAKADNEGLCVVLPCKIGSPVWRIYDDCEFPGDCGTKQKCNGCEYRNIFAEEQAFCLSMLSQNGKLKHPYYTSKEDAEKAIRERGATP